MKVTAEGSRMKRGMDNCSVALGIELGVLCIDWIHGCSVSIDRVSDR